MYVFGKRRSVVRPVRLERAAGAAGAASGSVNEAAVTPEGRRFEAALLVAGLPAARREAWMGQVLALAEKRPAWQEEDVGDEGLVRGD